MNRLVRYYRFVRDWIQGREAIDRQLELTGAILADRVRSRVEVNSLQDVEVRVYSQFGDDGIIQWLLGRLPGLTPRFVEFGVEDYTEANTRFLLVHDRWSGLVMDGDPGNIQVLRNRRWFWKHDLTAEAAFLTCENVDQVVGAWVGDKGLGLLHIDVDGNDYWLWQALECVAPGIVIVEYNGTFGAEQAITTPYSPDFRRLQAHYSGQYAGASLAALAHLGRQKGYALLGTNGAGNNAYFLRRDLLGPGLVEREVAEVYSPPVFRDSRTAEGRLDYKPLQARRALLRGMPVWNVRTGQVEAFEP